MYGPPKLKPVQGEVIDLTDPVNANWRENLRKNRADKRYAGKTTINLGRAIGDQPTPKKKK